MVRSLEEDQADLDASRDMEAPVEKTDAPPGQVQSATKGRKKWVPKFKDVSLGT